MEELNLEDLKREADELGLTYNERIGAAKLKAKIDEHYASLDKDGADKAVVVEKADDEETKPETGKKEDPRLAALRIIKEQERKNREPIVVKITMVDKREASYAKSAYFNTGSTAMRVPLDTWVEMPKILVDMAENAKALVHIEQSNGTSINRMQKKYVVEYKK